MILFGFIQTQACEYPCNPFNRCYILIVNKRINKQNNIN